jgi:branched-chain amino acid transport system substrate-binding protein
MDALRGAQVRVAEANASGGIGGRTVELIPMDSRQSPAAAVESFTDLAQQKGVCAVIGVAVANGGINVSPVAELMKVPFVSLGIDDRVTTPQLKPGAAGAAGPVRRFSFMVRPSASTMAAAMASYAVEHFTLRRYATLFDPSDAVSTIQSGSFAAAIAAGGRTLTVEAEMPPDGADFGPSLDSIARSDSEAVYVCGSAAQNAAAVKAIRARSLRVLLVGNQAWDAGFLAQAGDAVVSAWFATGVWASDPSLTELSAKTRAAFSEEARPFTAWGYDAAGLILAAVRKAGSSAPASVRDALERMSGFRAFGGLVDMDRRTHRLSPLPVAIMQAEAGAVSAAEPRFLPRGAARSPQALVPAP